MALHFLHSQREKKRNEDLQDGSGTYVYVSFEIKTYIYVSFFLTRTVQH